MKKSTISHRMAVKAADTLNKYVPKEGVAYHKVVLGAEVWIMNISKMSIIFTIAWFLDVLFPALLIMGGFFALRRTAFGVHALTSTGCTITSLVLMVAVPYFTWGFSVHRMVVVAVFALIFIAMWQYAPMDTAARPLVGANKRKRLKRQSIIACLVMAVVLVINPFSEITFMLMIGAMYSAVLILPITYKVLKREIANYERYEFG